MAKLSERLKESLSLKYFGWNDGRLRSFPEPQWQWLPPLALVVFRLVLMVYVVALLPTSIATYGEGWDIWFIYLTDWAYVLATGYWLILGVVSVHSFMRGRDNEGMPQQLTPAWHRVYSLYWFSAVLAINAAIVVTIGYWMFQFESSHLNSFPRNWINVNEHGIVFLLMVVDVFLYKIKIRWQHIYVPFVFCVVYVIFHVIYLEASSKAAYNILNHLENKGKAAFWYFFIAVAAPIISQSLWLLWYRLRTWCARRSGTDDDSREMELI